MVLPSSKADQSGDDGGTEAGVAAPPLSPQEIAGLRRNLVRAVAAVCPRWMANHAEDLVQDALIRLVDLLGRKEGNDKLSALYLRKAAYSVVVDEIRRRRRRQEVPLDDGTTAIDCASDAPDPERLSSAGETGQAIRDCLGRLIRPRRLAVTLYLQGHGVNEAARLLSWPAKKAENLIYRGLADLRGCLEAKGIRRR
jgi:RNA polymerase sigma-70 factor, ECF subfamily